MSDDEMETLVRALQALSPMPDDEQLIENPQRIDQYLQLVEAIKQKAGAHFNPDVIKALLHSFGVGDGFESYWATLHYIETFSTLEVTYDLIRDAVQSGPEGSRKWCCLLLGRRRNPADLPLLISRLSDTDVPVILEALSAIRMIASGNHIPEAISAVEKLLGHPEIVVSQAAQQTLKLLAK